MSWLELVFPLGVALAWLILPGLVVLACAGQRGFAAVALSPLVSSSLVAVAAVIGQAAGMVWSPLPVVILTVVAGIVTWGVRWSVDHLWSTQRVQETWASREQVWCWMGTGLGVALMARHVRNIFDRPDAFSQTLDNVFHLSAIRHIADSGRASSLTLMEINAGPGHPTFYPAAFHDLASLVFPVATDSPPVAVTAVVGALASVVWPLTCMYLVRSFLDMTPAAALGTGVLAASLPAFPVLLMDFGVLYPNLMGLALLPAVIGLAVQLLGLGDVQRMGWFHALLLGVLAVPALVLSHPNVISSLFLIVTPMVLTRAVLQLGAMARGEITTRVAALQVAGLSLGVLLMAATWPFIRPPKEAATWTPPLSLPEAVGQSLLNSPMSPYAMWAPSVLVILGFVAAWLTRHRWMIGSWLIVSFFWLVIASPSFLDWRMALTGNWYNDSYRYSAVFAHVALPLAALGFAWSADLVATRLRWGRKSWEFAVLGLAMAVALLLVTQRVPAMDAAVDRASANYQVENAPLVDADELALIERVPALVGPDAVVATNPWNGSSMLYALTGVETTTRHILYTPTPEVDVINAHLDKAGEDPARVCPAVSALDVTHVLDFGDREVNGAHHPYPGFDQLEEAPGFEEIAREGQAVLYEITACH